MSIKKINRIIVSAAVVAGGLAILAPEAQATNGYFVYGFGPTAKGMGGAAAAYSTDSMAQATNIAGMAFVGKRADFDVTLFNPNRDLEANGGGTLTTGVTESDTSFFEIPNFGVNYPIGHKWAIGFTMNANGGMNTEYPTQVFGNFNAQGGTAPTGVDLAIALMGMSITYKVTPDVAIGAGPVVGISRFKAYGLEAFQGISQTPGSVTGNGYDQSPGIGYRLGIQGKLNDFWSAGFGYQSRIFMKPFDKYRGLFAEQGDFDVPQTFNAGLALHPNSKLTIAADWQWINYNSVASIANSGGLVLTQVPGPRQLGKDAGLGFGWEDMNIWKIGAEYKYSDKLILRGGFSYNDRNPFDRSQILFNVLAPAVIRAHGTLGLEYKFFPNASVNIAYAHGFSQGFRGTDPNLGPNQTVTLSMDQNEGTIGFTYKW